MPREPGRTASSPPIGQNSRRKRLVVRLFRGVGLWVLFIAVQPEAVDTSNVAWIAVPLALMLAIVVVGFASLLSRRRGDAWERLSAGPGGIGAWIAGYLSTLLGIFAMAYWMLSVHYPNSFTEPLTKVDALYFAMATLSTTGYGDIAAKQQLARATVTLQMAIDLLVLAVLLTVTISKASSRKNDSPTQPDA